MFAQRWRPSIRAPRAALQKKRPRDAGPFRRAKRAASASFALDLDFHAAIRREAGDQFLHVLLVADDSRDGLRLAHPQRLDAVLRHAAADQVVANRVGTTLGQPLVV